MAVSPQTVILLRRLFGEYPTIQHFDLLLIACLCREVTPQLGFNFEEIDYMTDTLLTISSEILDCTFEQLKTLNPYLGEKKVLSAIKGATLLHQHTQGEELASLAERYDCYPLDLQILKKNMGWILETAQRVFSLLWKKERTAEGINEEYVNPQPCVHEMVCRALRTMLEYGIPHDCISLVEVKGVGARRAKTLIQAGIRTASQLSQTSINRVAHILKLKEMAAQKIVSSAGEVTEMQRLEELFGVHTHQIEQAPNQHMKGRLLWESHIDPYRLRRALELTIDHLSGECVRISGGAEPHVVSLMADRRGCNPNYLNQGGGKRKMGPEGWTVM